MLKTNGLTLIITKKNRIQIQTKLNLPNEKIIKIFQEYSALVDRENSEDTKILNAEDEEDEFSGVAVDMDSYFESTSLEEEDPNRYVVKKLTKSNYGTNDEDLLKTRTYNLHITYDKYYQVKS